jgi:E3 ubiquitin-protein ligase DOA10
MENNEVDELSPCAPTIKNACKICLDEAETNTNFLFNPCLCTGSCGTVHIDCLTQWIHVKVKK